MQKKCKKNTKTLVIPVYNGADYLEQAYNSTLQHDFDEIYIVDDASNDNGNTKNLINELDVKINKIFFQKNHGVSGALNIAVSESSSKYVSWLSHDDELTSDWNKAFKKLLKSKSDAIFTNYKVIDSFGFEKARVDIGYLVNRWIINKKNIDIFAFLNGLINGGSVILKRNVFNKIGYFDPALRTTQDYDFWYRLLQVSGFKYEPVYSLKYRVHTQQGTGSKKFIEEGNIFWINVLSDINNQKINFRNIDSRLLISVLYVFLSQSPYLKALNQAERSLNNILKDQFSINHIKQIKEGLRKGSNIFIEKRNNMGVEESIIDKVSLRKLLNLPLVYHKAKLSFRRIEILTILREFKLNRKLKYFLIVYYMSFSLHKRVFYRLFKVLFPIDVQEISDDFYSGAESDKIFTRDNLLNMISVKSRLHLFLGDSVLFLNMNSQEDFLKFVELFPNLISRNYQFLES